VKHFYVVDHPVVAPKCRLEVLNHEYQDQQNVARQVIDHVAFIRPELFFLVLLGASVNSNNCVQQIAERNYCDQDVQLSQTNKQSFIQSKLRNVKQITVCNKAIQVIVSQDRDRQYEKPHYHIDSIENFMVVFQFWVPIEQFWHIMGRYPVRGCEQPVRCND
jgi:formyltetrahydrofolate synthetase